VITNFSFFELASLAREKKRGKKKKKGKTERQRKRRGDPALFHKREAGRRGRGRKKKKREKEGQTAALSALFFRKERPWGERRKEGEGRGKRAQHVDPPLGGRRPPKGKKGKIRKKQTRSRPVPGDRGKRKRRIRGIIAPFVSSLFQLPQLGHSKKGGKNGKGVRFFLPI